MGWATIRRRLAHVPDPGVAAQRRAVAWAVALAVVTRLLYYVEHSGSAFFGVPILDEHFYDSVARALLGGGDVAAANPGFRSLL
ncbi:MAG: hypothetical protein AAGD06_05080 [Acidobacteriota bacterium]